MQNGESSRKFVLPAINVTNGVSADSNSAAYTQCKKNATLWAYLGFRRKNGLFFAGGFKVLAAEYNQRKRRRPVPKPTIARASSGVLVFRFLCIALLGTRQMRQL